MTALVPVRPSCAFLLERQRDILTGALATALIEQAKCSAKPHAAKKVAARIFDEFLAFHYPLIQRGDNPMKGPIKGALV